MERLDLAPDLNVVHELAALDLSGSHVGGSGPAQRQGADSDQQKGCHRQGNAFAAEKKSYDRQVFYPHQLGFRSSTAPFSTPETITCSPSFAEPSFTSRFSYPEPLFTLTKLLPFSVKIVSRCATSTLGLLASSMSTAEERSGRSLGSVPLIEKNTSSVRALPENALVCATAAMLSILPSKESSG